MLGFEAQLFVEGLAVGGGVEFYAFNFAGGGAVQRFFHETPGEAAAAIFRAGKHHADPSESSSVTEQSGGCDDAIIEFDGEAGLGFEAQQHLPIFEGLIPTG